MSICLQLQVDIEESPGIAHVENVNIVPTFKIYRKGSRVKEMVCPSPEVLESSVRHYSIQILVILSFSMSCSALKSQLFRNNLQSHRLRIISYLWHNLKLHNNPPIIFVQMPVKCKDIACPFLLFPLILLFIIAVRFHLPLFNIFRPYFPPFSSCSTSFQYII